MGQPEEAEAELRDLISDVARAFGPDHRFVAHAQAALSTLLDSPAPSTTDGA